VAFAPSTCKRLGSARAVNGCVDRAARGFIASEPPGNRGGSRAARSASNLGSAGKVVNQTQLLKVVRNVAKKGYAQIHSRQIRGVANIAFPVLDTSGNAMAVLNIPYLERIDKKITPSIPAIREMLRETAQRLSLLMGYVDKSAACATRRYVRSSSGCEVR
jgi:Bacterial transcriptional regulator